MSLEILDREIINAIETALNVQLDGHSLEQCTPEVIPQWDSVAHLTLVLLLEEKFDLIFDPEDINEMLNGGNSLQEVLLRKANK
jgi:acyl carrier protein